MKSTDKHWDSIFSTNAESALGWYETDLTKTFDLLHLIDSWRDATIFIPGAGLSSLIDELLKEEKIKLVLNDISSTALDKVKMRLDERNTDVQKRQIESWLCQDISQPIETSIPRIDIWIDRAVLHFLTDEKAIQGYFKNLKAYLKKEGYVLFAEFSQTGAEKCAGLNIHQYSVNELSERLGQSFKLVSSFNHVYINPRGDDKPYIYTLYQRID